MNFQSIKSEINNFLSIGLPLIASQTIFSLSGFIGTAMVSRLGEDALAASVLVSTIWFSFTVFFFGILNAISVLVSHQFGLRNKQAIGEIMGQSFILGLVTLIASGLLFSAMPFILQYVSRSAEVLTLSKQYMFSLFWTMPALIPIIIYEQFLTGINRTKFVLRISFLIVPIEIPLIYILVFGKFGLPKFGIAGVGYGFAITYSLTAIYLTLHFLKSKYYRQYHLFSSIHLKNYPYLKELLRVGLPMGLMHVVEVSTYAIITLWIAYFGTTILAAHQIALQFVSLLSNMVFAMSQTITVRIGNVLSENSRTKIYLVTYVAIGLSTFFMIAVAAAFYIKPQFFLRLDINLNDNKNSSLIHESVRLLILGGLLMIIDNLRMMGFGALRSLKDTRFTMYASIISFWGVALLAGYIIAFKLHDNASGIWWGLIFGTAVCTLAIYMRMYKRFRTVNIQEVLSIKH